MHVGEEGGESEKMSESVWVGGVIGGVGGEERGIGGVEKIWGVRWHVVKLVEENGWWGKISAIFRHAYYVGSFKRTAHISIQGKQ